jgi:hypothetical protein
MTIDMGMNTGALTWLNEFEEIIAQAIFCCKRLKLVIVTKLLVIIIALTA